MIDVTDDGRLIHSRYAVNQMYFFEAMSLSYFLSLGSLFPRIEYQRMFTRVIANKITGIRASLCRSSPRIIGLSPLCDCCSSNSSSMFFSQQNIRSGQKRLSPASALSYNRMAGLCENLHNTICTASTTSEQTNNHEGQRILLDLSRDDEVTYSTKLQDFASVHPVSCRHHGFCLWTPARSSFHRRTYWYKCFRLIAHGFFGFALPPFPHKEILRATDVK